MIDAAIRAPSGDNCQPWRFEIKNDDLLLYLLPDRDISFYSWGHRASLMALGAALENMFVAAKEHGFALSAGIQPEINNSNLVATLKIQPGAEPGHALYQAIFDRCTNRKPYQKLPLNQDVEKYLLSAQEDIPEAAVLLQQSTQSLESLASAAAINEKILFENFHMHKFFYDHILWTTKQDLKKRMGFYIKTLEVPGFAMPSFKLAKSWPILKFLNRVGFSKIIAKENSKTYRACSAIGAITAEDNSIQSYVAAGRLLQRTWLKVTEKGLQFQPLTGIAFLMQKVLGDGGRDLSAEHINLIKTTYVGMQAAFALGNQTLTLMFRIGAGPQPSARTLRLPAKIN
jgi:hypothetical protein